MPEKEKFLAIFDQRAYHNLDERRLIETVSQLEIYIEKLISIVNANKTRKHAVLDLKHIYETFLYMNLVRQATFTFMEAVEVWQDGYTQVIRPTLLGCDYLVKLFIKRMDFMNVAEIKRIFNFQVGSGNVLLIPMANRRVLESPVQINSEIQEEINKLVNFDSEKVIRVYQVLINCLSNKQYAKLASLRNMLENTWVPKVEILTLQHHVSKLKSAMSSRPNSRSKTKTPEIDTDPMKAILDNMRNRMTPLLQLNRRPVSGPSAQEKDKESDAGVGDSSTATSVADKAPSGDASTVGSSRKPQLQVDTSLFSDITARDGFGTGTNVSPSTTRLFFNEAKNQVMPSSKTTNVNDMAPLSTTAGVKLPSIPLSTKQMTPTPARMKKRHVNSNPLRIYQVRRTVTEAEDEEEEDSDDDDEDVDGVKLTKRQLARQILSSTTAAHQLTGGAEGKLLTVSCSRLRDVVKYLDKDSTLSK